MPHLIEVAFKGNRREFFLWEQEEAPAPRVPVIVDADRGEDLGLVHSAGELAEQRSAKVPHGLFGAPATRVAKRIANAEEVRRLDELRQQDEEARRKAMERVKANALVMKMTDAEWQWDRKKLTFYFTAEKRVDFRTLVRELASIFRTRIELKQIGVRDEAKRLDGVGRCGRQYCSASWLPELRPVNLGVAKDQRLSLNPSQISGACGRLMCCLRYEHDFYVHSRKQYPKEGKAVRTSRGEEKVIANDIFRERVTLRGLDGEIRTIALALLREEMLAAGDAMAASLAAAALAAMAPMTSDDDEPDEEGGRSALPIASGEPTGEHAISETDEYPVMHSPDHVSAPIVISTAEGETSEELPSDPASEEGRRPQRRRGRRGGRRNRPGGASGPRAPQDGGVPT